MEAGNECKDMPQHLKQRRPPWQNARKKRMPSCCRKKVKRNIMPCCWTGCNHLINPQKNLVIQAASRHRIIHHVHSLECHVRCGAHDSHSRIHELHGKINVAMVSSHSKSSRKGACPHCCCRSTIFVHFAADISRVMVSYSGIQSGSVKVRHHFGENNA